MNDVIFRELQLGIKTVCCRTSLAEANLNTDNNQSLDLIPMVLKDNQCLYLMEAEP